MKLFGRTRLPRRRKALQHLREMEFWPREQIRKYQFGKLQRLLQHCYENVPYYRHVLEDMGARPEDIRDFDDFAKLPILTKDLIRANRDSICATNLQPQEFIPNSTGGSTGEPLQLFQDANYAVWADAARIRGWYEIAGCRAKDRCGVLWGAVRDIRKDFTNRQRLYKFIRHGTVTLNAFNLSDERQARFARWLRWTRPKLLRGYVTAIEEFSRYVSANRLRFPSLRGIILCAETVHPQVQSQIEGVFAVPSYNTYGGRELSLIAMECRAKRGLHEVSENNYVEFEPLSIHGQENAGNLIVTNLNNYAMPFLRYRIGDIGIPSGDQTCPCGRGLPLIKRVIGRTTEVFEFYDGTMIVGEMFIHLMKDFPIPRYQFIQKSDRRMVLRTTRDAFISEELQAKIRAAYRPQLPNGVELDFETVDAFTVTATGKFRFVFREMNAEAAERTNARI